MDTGDIVKRLFDIAQQIATWNSNANIIAKSVEKTEQYLLDIVTDSQENKNEMRLEAQNVKNTINNLVVTVNNVQSNINRIVDELSQGSEPKTNCAICKEKEKSIAKLETDKKWLARGIVVAIVLALIALGMNFSPIRELLGLLKGGS